MSKKSTDPTDPAAPVPVRTERRTDTTRASGQPSAGAEDLTGPEARLPHERDEALDMTGGAVHPEIVQAFQDLEHGLQDTDRGLPAHNAYQKQK